MTKRLDKILFENVSHSNEEFTRHFHDTYTIGITYKGVIKAFSNSHFYESFEYSIRVNNPAEVHCGTSTSWTHANFYPTVELLSEIYESIFNEKRVPYFENHIINDKKLFFKIHNFFHAYFNKEDEMLIESNLIQALSELIIRHTVHTRNFNEQYNNTKIVKDTFELIKDSLDTNFSLEDLSNNVGLSKYHFLRVFKKEFGITPHAFIINERLNRAQGINTKRCNYFRSEFNGWI